MTSNKQPSKQQIIENINAAMNDPDFLESMADSREMLAQTFEEDLERLIAERESIPFEKQPLDAPILSLRCREIANLREAAKTLREQAVMLRSQKGQ